jgi:chromosome segregation ATPase
MVPEIEQRYRSIVEQIKGEHVGVVNELKQKALNLKALGEKLCEAQRANRELQSQIQRAKEEAAGAREDAAFHRAKSEEVTKRVTEQSDTTLKDANAAVQHLQLKLQDKTKENNVYQKLLSDTRRQLAPLMETTIPQYKAQVARLQRDRDELLKRVKRMAQLGVYVEQGMGPQPQSKDALAFCSALHQLQEELAPFLSSQSPS